MSYEPSVIPIVDAFLHLGDDPHLDEVVAVLRRMRPERNWYQEKIAARIQAHSSDASRYRNKDDLFQMVDGRGHWRLWCQGRFVAIPYGAPEEPGDITASQYAAYPEYPPHELIDGYLYRLVNSGLEQTRTSAALHNHFEGIAHSVNGLAVPCRGRGLKVKVGERSVVEPDLLYIRDKKAFHFTHGCIFECGVPNVMFEVLALGDARRDRLLKLHEYARVGIPEYWIVDPVAGVIDFLVLRRGSYVVQIPKAWCYQSPVSPEVRIDLREFWSPLVPNASGEVRAPVSVA